MLTPETKTGIREEALEQESNLVEKIKFLHSERNPKATYGDYSLKSTTQINFELMGLNLTLSAEKVEHLLHGDEKTDKPARVEFYFDTSHENILVPHSTNFAK